MIIAGCFFPLSWFKQIISAYNYKNFFYWKFFIKLIIIAKYNTKTLIKVNKICRKLTLIKEKCAENLFFSTFIV